MVNHIEVAKINKGTNGYKVDVITYSDDGDDVLVKKAEDMQVKTIPLSKVSQTNKIY
ncbi:hypothetical protein [Bacillus sp. B15-48]|uniref:hypothetical protein n=1 Tax=Bacillus sp. B15-48 TaxID=1548601 RepID=UPI00193F9C0E|nr:hypothetical protein [Bacillus sp. B15-48]MBM4763112.1 hypothetical protein [Bacillus sp. B15-48]